MIKDSLERITERKDEIKPVVEQVMSNFLGVKIEELNKDISNRIIEGDVEIMVNLDLPFKKAKDEFKKEFITNALRMKNGNISDTARVLSLDRRSIHRLIDRFKIKVSKLRKEPYYFNDTKKKLYVKDIIDKTLKKYYILNEKYKNIDEVSSEKISRQIPNITLSYEEAIRLFEYKYLKQALNRWKSLKETAKKIGIRYETLQRKLKALNIKI